MQFRSLQRHKAPKTSNHLPPYPPTTILKLILTLCLCTTTTHGLNIAITGTSQGIGLDAARRLLADGHTVIHACRNLERAEVAVAGAGGGIPMVCDLADLSSVRSFADALMQSEDGVPATLDVLCLNAGIAPSTKATAPTLTKDGFEECIGTNHLGHFLLANLLKDHLGQNGGGRLVVTASSVHDPEAPGGDVGGDGGATLGDLSGLGVDLRDGTATAAHLPTMVDGTVEYNGGKVYKDSKLCNVLFCREALKRWGDNVSGNGNSISGNVGIRSFNPGFIPSSGLFRAPRADNFLGATAFTFVAGLIGFAVPISVGGQRLAYMATAGDKEVPSGSYLSAETGSKVFTVADGFSKSDVSKEASDDVLASKLWDASEKIVGI